MSEAATADVPAGRFAGVSVWLKRRPLLILALFCLTLWTPGILSLPAFDRDESRYAQASKQMLESGDFVDIRFGAVPRYKKPVGIYWMQAATTEIAGLGDRSHIWTYRLPSLLGAIAAVWLAFWCARAFASVEAAFLAAALLGSTILLTAEATMATTDAALLACVLGAQGVLLRTYIGARANGPPPSLRLALAGWVAFAIGILVKGPLIAGVVGASIVALSIWDREWRWLRRTRPLVGLGLTLLIVLPWLIAIGVQSHGQFLEQSLGHDFAAKLQGGEESHGAWPGYFLLLATLTFWPAILFLLPGLTAAIRQRVEPAQRFLLVWIASWWLIVELVPTKLPHYVLPVYPALAMLAAIWALGSGEAPTRWERMLRYVAALQFALGAAALTAAPIILSKLYGEGAEWWLIAAAGSGAVIALGALITFLWRANLAAAVLAFVSVLVFYPLLTAFVGPGLEQLWVSPRAAAAVKALTKPGDPPPALAGYVEPSLVFALGTETRQTDGRGAADAGAAQGGLALVEDREQSAFLAHLAELETDASEVGSVSGFNYSRGRRVHVRIYRVVPLHDVASPPPE